MTPIADINPNTDIDVAVQNSCNCCRPSKETREQILQEKIRSIVKEELQKK